MWQSYINGFKAYLTLERSMSDNTLDAYLHDVTMLSDFMQLTYPNLGVEKTELSHLQAFLNAIGELELSANSQARVISGIKSFFRYLREEELMSTDPTELLDSPKLTRPLPHVLSIQDLELLFATIDHSTPEGQRNRAMLETMYSCGLRVSELISIRLTDLYLDLGFIKVIGKGNKERLVPIGSAAINQIKLYKDHVRSHLPKIKPGNEDILFLGRWGSSLSRVMVFLIIKELAAKAGLTQEIHPHTFRHSFATHLVEAGADLRAVQAMLGHKSITTTEIYTHLDKSYLRDTLEKYHPRFK